MRYIYTLLIFTSLGLHLKAQSLQGSIKDAKSGEALIGATALIKGTTNGAKADLDGNFIIPNPGKPPFTLVVSFVGYKTNEIQITSLDKPIVVKMSTNEEVLKEFEIIDTRLTDKQKESPLTVEALDLLAIKETPAANFYDGLGTLKGVDLTAASLGFKIINTRGFNSTSPVRSLQIIDGVDNQAPGLNFSLGNFLGSSELDVQKVDIIVGASSAFYGPNAFNGVISMTTKNPFDYTGLTVQAKVGERELFETSIRWAQKFKNRDSVDKFAYKINVSFMKALDWQANNMNPTEQSLTDARNPGGYDAVNRYGDEELGGFQFNFANSALAKSSTPGLGVIYRNGYNERDLVDYNTNNLKLNAAFHYKIKNDIELIFSSNFGTGTTIYQGENRFSLRDILFFQNKFEISKKDKFFVRAYATHEDAGNSFDAVVTAFELQNLSKTNDEFKSDYRNRWVQGGFNAISFKIRQLPGYPIPFDENVYDSLMIVYRDTLVKYHEIARDRANTGLGINQNDYYEAGTARFDSAMAQVKSRTLADRGSLLKDRSALYHVHGEYKEKLWTDAGLTLGANFRQYRPNSEGTIFSDTLMIDRIENGDTLFKRNVIINNEFGAYMGLQQELFAGRLRLNGTARVDKNQNFNYISTQSFSAVYTINNNHTFRLVYSSAIRNPTLQDQYLFYNVGRAILIGNINGRDSLITVSSFFDYLDQLNTSKLQYFDVDPIRPERVNTVELGYRGTLFNKVYVDMSYYRSRYTDFIGFKIGLDVQFSGFGLPGIQAYRLAANTNDIVYTQGFSGGINYYFADKYSINGNYSWNVLSRPDSTDEIITAFNTPEHKYNIGINGRNMKLPWIKGENFGFNINYKWVQGFTFEGAPQFTGAIPSYGMADAQINWNIKEWKTIVKLGASNILNNKVFMVYGGPLIGRLAYFSVTVDIP